MGEVVVRMGDRSEEMATRVNNIIFVGLYKGINKVLGAGARGLGVPVGQELLKAMKETYNLSFEGSNDPQELLNRFTHVMIDTFGFADKGEIDVNGNEVTLKLENPMDLFILEELKKEGIEPALYPMANAIIAAIKDFSGKKAMLREIGFEGKNVTVKIRIIE